MNISNFITNASQLQVKSPYEESVQQCLSMRTTWNVDRDKIKTLLKAKADSASGSVKQSSKSSSHEQKFSQEKFNKEIVEFNNEKLELIKLYKLQIK